MNRFVVLVAVTALAATGACTSTPGGPPGNGAPPGGGAPWDGAARIISDARSGGASPAQMAILEQAASTGQISFEDYSAAIDETLRCIREAGLQLPQGEGVSGVSEQRGFKIRFYSLPGDASGVEPVAERCYETHSAFVERAYQLQPSSVEAENRRFRQYRDALLDCLRRNGVTVDNDMTRDEIERAGAKLTDDRNVNCFHETGYL